MKEAGRRSEKARKSRGRQTMNRRGACMIYVYSTGRCKINQLFLPGLFLHFSFLHLPGNSSCPFCFARITMRSPHVSCPFIFRAPVAPASLNVRHLLLFSLHSRILRCVCRSVASISFSRLNYGAKRDVSPDFRLRDLISF